MLSMCKDFGEGMTLNKESTKGHTLSHQEECTVRNCLWLAAVPAFSSEDGVKANLHAVLDYLVSAEMTDLEWVRISDKKLKFE